MFVFKSMAKIMFLIVLAYLICYFVRINDVSVKESEGNFVVFEQKLDAVARKYFLSCEPYVSDGEVVADGAKDYIIEISDSEWISIYLENTGSKDEEGQEEVTVTYEINDNRAVGDEMGRGMNIPLYVDVVNAVSAKKVSVNYCNDFLKAPEYEHDAVDSGLEKSEDMLVYKYQDLNFFNDWSISYELYDDNWQVLEFWGLTSNSLNK